MTELQELSKKLLELPMRELRNMPVQMFRSAFELLYSEKVEQMRKEFEEMKASWRRK